MPVYTYRREDGSTFDIRQSFRDEALATCPTTGQPVTRVIQPAGIIFKGSGFYVNDSSKTNHSASPPASNGDDKTKSAKDDSAKKSEADKEAKPAKKTTAKQAAAASK